LQVINVNNVGNKEYPGTLEVTDEYLKFYINGKTSPVSWKFSSMIHIASGISMFIFRIRELSPYGDDGLFSFKTDRAGEIFHYTKDK